MIRVLTISSLLISSAMLLSSCASVATSGALAGARVYSQERTLGNAIDDLTIETAINSRYFHADANNLFQRIDPDVLEGRVLLTGSVISQAAANRAIEIAWQIQGVREVINELQIAESASLAKQAEDLWITTYIEGQLLITKGIRSANYNIETENGIVTLMGIAQDTTEIENVAAIASRTRGVEQVISHVMLKDDPRRSNPLTPAQKQTIMETPQMQADRGLYSPVQATNPYDGTNVDYYNADQGNSDFSH